MQIKTIAVNGIQARYLETDASRDAPLVMLHGWGSSVHSWENVAKELEKRNIKTFIPDLPGFGETEEPPVPWGLYEYINFVHSFAQAMKFQKFTLSGHSFGGQIAIGYAAVHPQDLQKLILISAARIMRRKKLKVAIFQIFSKIGNCIFSVPPFAFLRPTVQKIWSRLSGEKDYYRASKLMRKTMKFVLRGEMRGELAKINMPTLVLWGEKDLVTPLADAKILHNEIEGSILHVFPDENHDLNIKIPEKLAAEIAKFLL